MKPEEVRNLCKIFARNKFYYGNKHNKNLVYGHKKHPEKKLDIDDDVLPISSGIGLTIASSIVHALGGKGLEVHSEPGGGTEVSFELYLRFVPKS